MMYWQGMGWWGWLIMISFWVVVLALLIWAVRTPLLTRSEGDRALRVLDERLARGEIEISEYEARREALERRR